ncbi:MAG: zinc ribbon domain-containing protein [Desulfuromonas thiophila]|jgi:hypothetical protein|nr:zinc ribbon domain-containing protein [Desulfuromonas thiophila]
MTTKVYQYGIHGLPDQLPEPAFQQLRLQNNFWNALVEADRANETAYLAIVNNASDQVRHIFSQIEQVELQISNLRDRLQQEKIDQRSKTPATTTKDEIKALVTQMKDLKAAKKEAVASSKAAIKPQLDALNEQHKAACKALRQHYASEGLYWCNYNKVADSYRRARAAVLGKRGKGQSAKLNFHRFSGEGYFEVQIQGGMTVADLFGGKSTQLQIDPVDPVAWYSPSRAERRAKSRTTGRLRVTSDGISPVWLPFRAVIHRPIPPAGAIKAANITRRKLGTKWQYQLNITVTLPDTQVQHPHPCASVAIDLGWRILPNRIRVAYLQDDTGQQQEISLDASYTATAKRLEELQAIMDERFHAAKDHLKTLLTLADRTDRTWPLPDMAPEELDQIAQRLPHWRNAAKLLRLVEEMRPTPDEDVQQLRAWAKKHKHLYDWQANLRHKLQGRRRDYYRRTARALCEKYGRIILEDFAMPATRSEKDSDPQWQHYRRRAANLASPGYLRQEIERCAAETGSQILKTDAAGTTTHCPKCGTAVKTDPCENIQLQCHHCGHSYDQDQGACENLLKASARKISTSN